jgi:hypothetical protein
VDYLLLLQLFVSLTAAGSHEGGEQLTFGHLHQYELSDTIHSTKYSKGHVKGALDMRVLGPP